MIYKIEIDINIADDNAEVLKKVLGTTEDRIDLSSLKKLTKTALIEYIDMIAYQGIPSRIQDLKTRRLLLLIENFFVNKLPTETELIALFKINERIAKTVIDETISLHQNRIELHLETSIKNSLTNFSYDDEDKSYEGVIQSKVLFDKINEIITREKPGLESLSKKKKTSGKYTCKIDTYNFLKEKYLKDVGGNENE